MTALLVAATLFTTQANLDADAPTPEPSKPLVSSKLSPSDEHVLSMLHARDSIENELGRLAKTQAASKQVKAFGLLVAKDHAFLDRQVLALARRSGVELKPWRGTTDEEREKLRAMEDTVAQLKDLKGEAFDKLFVDAVERWHQDDIAAVEAQRSLTTDIHVYALLGKVLPVLREHRSIAEKLSGRTVSNG
jgi:putative membrane protein